MENEQDKARPRPQPRAWRISAPRSCGFELHDPDANFLFRALAPGDAVLLLDDAGECAWGVRRVLLVRRVPGGSIAYFDRRLDFAPQPVAMSGKGDKRVLRRIDFAIVEAVLKSARLEDGGGNSAWTFQALCNEDPADTPANRAYVRRLLETIVKDDLLGPAGGPEEEIVGMSVRDRYILGRLGPRREDETGGGGPTDEDIREAEESPDENKNGNEDHAEHDEIRTPATDIAEEEPEEDVEDALDVTRSNSLVPSSMGLTFSIDAMLPDVEVEVSWGSYYRTKSETAVHPETGTPLNCWKRVPFGGKKVLSLAEGTIESYNPDERIGTVRVIGSVSRPVGDSRLVTLFLVNEQREPEKNRDAAWLFQPEIVVRSPGGGAIFKKRPLQDLSKDDDELKALDMVYRKRVEFAVGHNTSVHATPSPDNHEHAVEIRTTPIPHYEVPATEVPGKGANDRPVLRKLTANHKLDMRAIAAAMAGGAPGDIENGVLGQLVGDYARWIEERKAQAAAPEFDFFRKAANANLAKCAAILERLRAGIAVLQGNEAARKAFAFANGVMADQRVHSVCALRRRQGKIGRAHV